MSLTPRLLCRADKDGHNLLPYSAGRCAVACADRRPEDRHGRRPDVGRRPMRAFRQQMDGKLSKRGLVPLSACRGAGERLSSRDGKPPRPKAKTKHGNGWLRPPHNLHPYPLSPENRRPVSWLVTKTVCCRAVSGLDDHGKSDATAWTFVLEMGVALVALCHGVMVIKGLSHEAQTLWAKQRRIGRAILVPGVVNVNFWTLTSRTSTIPLD